MTSDVRSPARIGTLPRVLVSIGVAIAAVMAVVIFVTRWAGATGSVALRIEGLAGSLAFAVLLAGPAWLAARTLRSGQRGPLLPALVLVVLVTFTSFSVFVFGGLLVAILWGQAFLRWPPSGRASRVRVAVTTLGAAALGVVAMTALFVHVDPYCWQEVRTNAGGTVVQRVPATTASGFAWQVDATSGMGQSIGGDSDVVSSGCGSDRIVPAEAAASVLAGLAALAVAARDPRGEIKSR